MANVSSTVMSCVCVVMTTVILLVASTTAQLLRDSSLGLTEVAWHPEKTHVYIGSPSIIKLDSGVLVASADRFGNLGGQPVNVSIYHSYDQGQTWNFTVWVLSHSWSNLFTLPSNASSSSSSSSSSRDEHDNKHDYKHEHEHAPQPQPPLYLLGTDNGGLSQIKISRSRDGGVTWNESAILFSFNETDDATHHGFETGPTPTLVSGGRVYRAMERCHKPFAWGAGYEAAVISAPLTADLLDPSVWTLSSSLPLDMGWLPRTWSNNKVCANPGYLEGNMVEGSDGAIYNVLRFNSEPGVLGNWAISLKVTTATTTTTATAAAATSSSTTTTTTAMSLAFDALVALPGGHTKFVIRKDTQSGWYFSLVNPNLNINYTDQRNVLALAATRDPTGKTGNWTPVATILTDDTGLAAADSVRYTGFHYVDWQFDGDDIIMLIRTGYRGAVSYHNSNRLTFKRLTNFRRLLGLDSATLHVSGSGFVLEQFLDGKKVFSDRPYDWTHLTGPFMLPGNKWNFTMIAGQGTGEPANGAHIVAEVVKSGSVFILTELPSSMSDPAAVWLKQHGFELQQQLSCAYTDTHDSPVNVYAATITAGTILTIPQSKSFVGTMLLIPEHIVV